MLVSLRSVKHIDKRKMTFITSVFLLLIISMLSIVTTANNDASWIPFIPEAVPGSSSEVLPKSGDTTGLCIDSNFMGMYSLPTYVNETRYNVLHIPAAGHVTEVGKPAVPKMTRFLEIPDEVQVNIEIIYEDMQILENYYVIPAQEPHVDIHNASEPPFMINDTIYKVDAFYPSEIASLEGADGADPIIIRGHRIAALSLYPVQFNPVKQQLKIYSKIEVRINYEKPAQVGPLDPRLISPAFETLLDALVLNYQPRPLDIKVQTALVPLVGPHLWIPTELPYPTGEGADYLIITHDDFFKPAQELAAWKEKKGLITKIVNTTQITTTGPTANDIETYIQNAYDTWNPAPTFVLLFGDSDHIPPHYLTPHPSASHGNFEIPTDLHFVTVEGDDIFQDIYIGRLSVNDFAQATTVVNKILEYERNPPSNADFYNQVTACALFQDEDTINNLGQVITSRNGFEDRRFVLTSEEIRDYLTQVEGYDVDRIYWARDPDPALPDGQDPTNYNGAGDMYNMFDNGDPLPPDLLWPGFTWDGDTLDITNNITDGRFLIYHRDHGSSRNFWRHSPLGGGWGANVDGWTHPDYDTGDIAGLMNDPLLPVVFSIECQCGWFDGEVDQQNDPALTRNSESFCEEFVRQQGGGAIAAIGSARNSYSGYNDDMVRGFIDAIWPGFDPDFESGGLYHLGQVITYGKIYMATFRPPPDDLTTTTFEEFHLFGDPELSIWTEEPAELDVLHPTSVGSSGRQRFVVNVTNHDTGAPVHFAKVCIRKNTDVYSVVYTDPAGGAYFSINPSSGGTMEITVTRHNFEPYESTITVTNGGASLTINPDSGPQGSNPTLQGSNFDDGEIVDVFFGEGTFSDDHFEATAGSFDEIVTVPAGPIGPINVRVVGRTSGKYAVAMFRRLPDQPLPDPYTYSQWDSSTWHLNPDGSDPRWNSPTINLYEANTGNPVASNDLRVGTTYTVKADIYNDATEPATNTEITFEWTNFGTSQTVWNKFGTDTITVPAGGSETAETNWTPSITGHSCIRITIYHAYDENLNNNKGQENTDVHPVSSPGMINFVVGNPTQQTALVYLDAKQIGGPDLWAATIERDYPQVQEPGDVLNGTLFVEAPDDAEIGENRTFTVSGYIDGELIGGVEINVVVKIPTTVSCSVSPSEVTQGVPVTISGSINPAVAGATVLLAYRSPDGTDIERTVTTDTDGFYSDSYQPDIIGSWSVTASWRGDPTHIEAKSPTNSFSVEKKKPCQIIQAIVIVFVALVLYLIRNRSREVRILGFVAIIIALLLYYWYCIGWYL